MTIGTQYATVAFVEAMRRKLERLISGAGIDQHDADGGAGAENFIELADCPQTYADAAGELPSVNAAEDGLEFNPYVTLDPTAPIITIRNMTDDPVDCVHQVAVGATPLVKWTWGLDASDENKWKLANATALGVGLSGSFSWGDTLYFTWGSMDSIVGVELDDFSTDAVYIVGGTGSEDGKFNSPRQIAYDGTYIYVADGVNYRIQKFVASTGAFVSHTTSGSAVLGIPRGCVYWDGYLYVTSITKNKVFQYNAYTLNLITSWGSVGTGDDQFNNPASLTTDGTYLFICDEGNDRIKKHTLSGDYVAQVGSAGSGNGEFSSPFGIATDGITIYVTDYYNNRVQEFACSDLAYLTHIDMPNRTGDGPGYPSAITLNGTHWYVAVADDLPCNGYIIKYDIATDSLQAYYDGSIPGYSSIGVSWGMIILKDKVTHGDLLVVHEDGSLFDIYPKTRFFDSIRLHDSALETGEYVGLRSPSDVTASYYLTFPATANADKSHLCASAGAALGFGQNVDTDGSPTFANITDSGLTATHPVFTDGSKVLISTGTVPVDHGGTGAATFALNGVLFGNLTSAIGVTAIGAEGNFLRVGASPFVPAWSTLTLPNTGTAFRLPVFSAANVMTELAAVGATGQYLAGNTGAIPSWANVSAFEPALGNPGTTGWVLSSTDGGVRSWVAQSGGAVAFLDLTDVDEADYVGHEGEFVVVNAGADGLEFSASSVAAHDFLSATHSDTTAAAVVRGDIIIGSVAAPNTKWTRLAVGAAGTYLAGSAAEPSWATLNQAAVAGLTTADGPSFDHIHLTIAGGTAPLVVTSDTEVANLNAHLLQGYHANAFLLTATTGATITVSDSAASGGSNGDIWLEY